LPAVSLFIGPSSVGKWELAEQLRAHWKFRPADVLRVKRLTQDNARFIAKFASERPQGHAKLVLVRLDQRATKGAQNTLLKTLEDSSTANFILIAESEPLPTIRSRAAVFPFGLLSEEEIALILQHRRNYTPERAEELAKVAGGQVRTALSYVQAQESKVLVLKALDALYRRDLSDLESLAPRWQSEHTELLTRWCYEALTRKWVFFLPEESSIVGTKVPLRILMALREDLRPRLVVRAALATVLQE
jgi:DNA polymerase III delta prime subunit